MLEIFFSSYGCLAVFICIFSSNIFFLPIVTIQTIGFVYVTYLSIVESWKKFSTFKGNKLRFSEPLEAIPAVSGTINNLDDKASVGLLGRGMFRFHLRSDKNLAYDSLKFSVFSLYSLVIKWNNQCDLRIPDFSLST